jgi:hypothetical protein
MCNKIFKENVGSKTLESIKEEKGKAPKWAKEGLNTLEGRWGGDLFE